MEILRQITLILFVLFLIYTVIYSVQWIFGLSAAVSRLSRYEERRKIIPKILPDEIAKSMPVSVIIPAYNEENCICDTIRSLLEEDYPELQILVIDDGSSDKTSACVAAEYELEPTPLPAPGPLKSQSPLCCWTRDYGQKHLTLVRKENGGKADALNCGLNFCTSPHCIVLDADTRVERGSIRILRSRFVTDPDTIVCAGAVGNSLYGTEKYKSLSFVQKTLVLFQTLEYYRTFYMQRVLFDAVNANTIVSGAFAMFDTELLRDVGGYLVRTIGEDMELTMRLHAFCQSRNRPYHISYMPEARCRTQVPFTYRDFCHQRRRWHIGMIQSLKQHRYMLGRSRYGWAGVLSGTFTVLYELMAPFIEILGLLTLIVSSFLGILNLRFTVNTVLIYSLLTLLTQAVLIKALRKYRVDPLPPKQQALLMLVSLAEFFFFHLFNLCIKLNAFFTARRHKKTWNHIERAKK